MDWSAEYPDELERAAARTLLAVSAVTLGALALPGLFTGEWIGKLLLAGALLIAIGAAPMHDGTLQRRAQLLAAGAALVTWLLAIPLFEREGMIVPAAMALGCVLVLRAVALTDDAANLAPPAARTPTGQGWLEEDGRRLPW
jgi:hypothetical protein